MHIMTWKFRWWNLNLKFKCMTIKSNGPISSPYFINFPDTFQTTGIDDAFLMGILSFLWLLLYYYISPPPGSSYISVTFPYSSATCYQVWRRVLMQNPFAGPLYTCEWWLSSGKGVQRIQNRIKQWLDSLIWVRWQGSLCGRWKNQRGLEN